MDSSSISNPVYFEIGSSKFRKPSSCSCIMATAVEDLVIEPMGKKVSEPSGISFS